MKATVVVDNIASMDCQSEWGLCIYITYRDKKILLDAGASGLFCENAKKLDIALSEVDYAVLSHAHYDHANGMRYFFEQNEKAAFYLREGCQENCYGKKWIFSKYIGLPKGILKEYARRIQFVTGDYQLAEGIYLIPHKTAGLEKIGKRESMYVKENKRWRPDDFAHEQSLVFDTAEGLLIFNSCSHGGADHIIEEVQATFPDKKVYGIIGGFHLFHKSEAEIRLFANRVKETGIQHIYTGHCTGARAYAILQDELGEIVHQIKIGMEIEIKE